MKTTLRVLSLLLFLLVVAGEPGSAQTFTDPAAKDPGYEKAKRLARHPLANKRAVMDPFRQQRIAKAGAKLKNNNKVLPCILPLIPASTAIPRSDDGSFGPLQLPFDFKLYGTVYNQVWINTNGNLTFTGPYGAHTAAGFPVGGQPMIAPFWGDVDTRHAASGQVYYMLDEEELIVTWDKVGYNGGADKTNTFQLIIGSEESSFFNDGHNVAFYYGDMQWATAGGFGGPAATVGANKGDGTQYFQVGRFSEQGMAYDGPGGNHDGIDYLDNKCITFNASEQQNLPPTVLGLPYINYIEIKPGETANLDLQVLGPEQGQQVTIEIDTTDFCNVDYTVTNGAMATAKLSIKGDNCNAGFRYLTLTATDNGNPEQSTSVFLIVYVNAETVDQVITFPAPVDEDGDGRMALQATASSGLPVSYFVTAGSAYVNSADSLIIEGGGQITIRAYQMGDGIYNYAEKDVTICVPLRQPREIYGDTVVCVGSSITYSLMAHLGTTVNWSLPSGGTLQPDEYDVTVTWTTPGIHYLTAHYTSACTAPGPARTYKVRVTNQQLSGSFTNLLPADAHTGLDLPITFSWSPIPNATHYDIYLWPDTVSRPEEPFIREITGINYRLYFGDDLLQYGYKYKWQLVARNVCDTLEAPVHTFIFRQLPDLTLPLVQPAPTGYSGQPFSIRWEVKNTGLGSTMNGLWYDKFYLSRDRSWDAEDIALGQVINMSALNSGAGYINTASFTLPQGISDKFYVIGKTNYNGFLEEADSTNNTFVTATASTIQLTPPPDLQVTVIVPPNIAFSGLSVPLKWTVANKGTGNILNTTWTDRLYLSKTKELNPDSAILLGSYTQFQVLNGGGEYTQELMIRIPDTVYGQYYFQVVADVHDQVYEHAGENNNTRASDLINIIPKPPVDLVVPRVTIPAAASNGETITVNWRVENAGGSSTDYHGWWDKVYLSKTTELNEKEAVLLGTAPRPMSLAPGEGYNTVKNYTIPKGITGNYYVLVKTDAENFIFEYEYELNNTGISDAPLLVKSPDLVIAQLAVPAKTASGEAVAISWTVKNKGVGTVFNTRIKDRILLSANPIFDEANSVLLKEIVYQTGELAAGADTVKLATVMIPQGIAGNYYLYVQTDSSNMVYESDSTNNVLRSTAAVQVTLSPWADLQVTTVTIPDSATAGGLLSLQYTIANKGRRAVDTTWKDRIYLSLKPQYDTASVLLLQELRQVRLIGKDSAFQSTVQVKLPGQAGDSIYYVYVVANAGKDIYEHTDSTNNITRSKAVYINRYPPVDLIVTDVSAPVTASSGKPVTIKWAVKNQGDVITLPNQWHDGVYLSADKVWDAEDRLVKEFVHRGALPSNAGYADEQTVILPNGVAGRYYLMVVTDHRKTMADADTTNNYQLVRPAGSGSEPLPMDIELTTPPDLVVNPLTVPAEGIAGQPVRIKWIIRNSGAGVTAASSWTEKIYLSDDLTVDTTDKVLGTYTHTGALEPGGFYEDSLQVYLPNYISGNYMVILKADAHDNVYEHGAEENMASRLITIAQLPLTDLEVTGVKVPDTVVAGEPVTLQWTLKNTGANAMKGFMREAIYLSTDTIQDVKDIVVEVPETVYNIPSQGSVDRSFTTELSGLSLQGYYVLVHTDIRNNVAETNDDNNRAVSRQPMQVVLKEIVIGKAEQRTLPVKKSIYYRIEIPDSLAGQSLLISLKGDSLQGHNELFLRHADVPDRAVYDFTGAQPFEGNQEIIVPALNRGTYYLMVYGNTANNKPQPITLLASILHFEVRSVDAAKGGNTGMVTIQLKGSKLGNVTKVRLRRGNQVIPSDHITPVSAISLFARFNLQGAPAGVYDVVAENEAGDTAVLLKGFTIEAGSASQLLTTVAAPPNTRPSNVVVLRVQFTNAGNTDLVSPVLKLTSIGGAPIAFSADELDNARELTLQPRELNGPAGILRPGASGTILVYAKATTVLGFTLMQPGF